MKKQILLALPLATGLFAVSGAANAAGTYCRVSDDDFNSRKGSGCSTIYIDEAPESATTLTLDAPEVTITSKDGVVFGGKIVIKSNVNRVNINGLDMTRGTGASLKTLIEVSGPTELNINDSTISDAKTNETVDTIKGDVRENDVTAAIVLKDTASNAKVSLSNTKLYASNGILNEGAGYLNIDIRNDSRIRSHNPIDLSKDPVDAGSRLTIDYSTILGVSSVGGGSNGVIILNDKSGAEVNISNYATLENYLYSDGGKQMDLIHVNNDEEGGNPATVLADHAIFNNTDAVDSIAFNAESNEDAQFVAKTSWIKGDGKWFNDHQLPVIYSYNDGNDSMLIAVDEDTPISDYYRSQEPVAPEGYVYDWKLTNGLDTIFDFSTRIREKTELVAELRQVANTTPGDTPSDTPSDNQGGIGSENQGAGSGNDNVDNPNTADSITLYMTVATIALLGLGATALIAKKSRR